MTHDIADEQAALEQVAERLGARFPDVSPETVAATVNEVYASLADAHVRDFLPVLIEREAKKLLKKKISA